MQHRSVTRIATVLSLSALMLAPAAASAAAFEVDGAHSSVGFKVKSRDTYFVQGIFGQVAGTADLGNADASKNKLEFAVKAGSVQSGNDKRDEHLRGPDFFNSKQFPDIKFVATSVTADDKGNLKAQGNITLLGVTKPITVDLEKVGGSKNDKGKEVLGYEARFVIDRSEFGMKYGAGAIDNKVHLTANVALISK